MRSDIGGYLVASYVSFMIYSTSYQILNRSDFFDNPGSFLTFPSLKYQKSSLSEEDKDLILAKINKEMEERKYFINESGFFIRPCKTVKRILSPCVTGN